MKQVTYDDCLYELRQDFADSHSRYWQRLASPGVALTGAERVAIAREVRSVADCRLCTDRKNALSPGHVEGNHDAVTSLRPTIIETVHAVTSDPSRRTRRWYHELVDTSLSESEYVEIVGTVVAMVSIDCFASSLGLPLRPLPEPEDGEPSGYRPARAEVSENAWVPMVALDNADTPEADLWESGKASNVVRALSLAPDEVRTLKDLSAAHYLPLNVVRVAGDNASRALTRSQMELVAGRISALNKCFY